MNLVRNLYKDCYTVEIDRFELQKAFQSQSEFDKLITKIAKVIWDEKEKHYEDIPR